MQKLHRLSQPTEMDTQRGIGRFPPRRQIGRKCLQRFDDLDLCFVVVPGSFQQHGKARQVVCAEHDIDPRGALDDPSPVFLREAATDRDLHVRSPLLDRIQLPQVAVEPIVGVLAHRTGVENDDVRTVRHVSGRALVSGLLEQAGCRSESWTFIWHP